MKKTMIKTVALGLFMVSTASLAHTLTIHSNLARNELRSYADKTGKALNFIFASVDKSGGGSSRYKWQWAPRAGKDSLRIVYPNSVQGIRLVQVGVDPVTTNHDFHGGVANIMARIQPSGHGNISVEQSD